MLKRRRWTYEHKVIDSPCAMKGDAKLCLFSSAARTDAIKMSAVHAAHLNHAPAIIQ
jgi:hypothetical protein